MSNCTLTMLGTGHALVTQIFNTCFTIKSDHTLLLTDTGGGNGILRQLQDSGTNLRNLEHLFITHAHTDHLLGAPWVLRSIAGLIRSGQHRGHFTVYSHAKVLQILNYMLAELFSKRDREICQKHVQLQEIAEGQAIAMGDFTLIPFDIHSTKATQYGYRLTLPDGKVVVCLGDEPFNELCRPYAENADYLLCEAFCLKKEEEVYHPYQKNHSTAWDAGCHAADLKARNLVIYHTEEDNLSNRQASYFREAAENFKGPIYIPDDLDSIELI